MKIVTKVADADQANLLLELAGSDVRTQFIMYKNQERYVWYDDDSFAVTMNPPGSEYDRVSKQFFLFAIETCKLIPDIGDDVEYSMDGGTTWEKPTDPTFCTQPASDMLVRSAPDKRLPAVEAVSDALQPKCVPMFNKGDVVLSTNTGRKGIIVLAEPDKHGHILIDFNGFYGLHRVDSLKHYRPSQLELILDSVPDDVLNICDLEFQLKWLIDNGKVSINERYY